MITNKAMFVKRLVCCLIAVSIIIVQMPVADCFAESSTRKYITVVADGSEQTLLLYERNGTLFINTEDIPSITRYKIDEKDDKNIRCSLGSKSIVINKKDGSYGVYGLYLTALLAEGKFSDVISNGDEFYIPIEEILPWLNTNVSDAEGNLILTSDTYSIWELVSYDEERVSCYNIMDGIDLNSGWTTSGLVTLSTIHTFFNTKWQRFIPMKAVDSRYERTTTLYDVENYKACLFDMADDDTLYSDKVDEVMKNIKNYGKVAGTLDEMFDIDDADRDNVASFLIGLRESTDFADITNNDVVDVYGAWTKFDDAWQDVAAVGEVAGAASKVLESAKKIEIVQKASPDYYRAICYLAENVADDNFILKTTAADTKEALESVMGTVMRDAMSKCESLLTKGLEKGLGGEFTAITSVIKAGLNIVYPSFVKAAEEADKLSIYSDVMNESRVQADNLLHKENPTVVEINNARSLIELSYFASKSGKKITDNILKSIGKEKTMDKNIDSVEESIIKMALTSDSALNDSAEGKGEFQSKVKKALSKVNITEKPRIDLDSVDKEYLAAIVSHFIGINGEVEISQLSDEEIVSAVIGMVDIVYAVEGTKNVIPFRELDFNFDGRWNAVAERDFINATNSIYGRKLTNKSIVRIENGISGFKTGNDINYDDLSDASKGISVDKTDFLFSGRNGRGHYFEIVFDSIGEDEKGIITAEYHVNSVNYYGAKSEDKIKYYCELEFTGNTKYPFKLISVRHDKNEIYGEAFDSIGKTISELQSSYGTLTRAGSGSGLTDVYQASNGLYFGFSKYISGDTCISCEGDTNQLFNVPENISLNELAATLGYIYFDESEIEFYENESFPHRTNDLIWYTDYNSQEYKLIITYDKNFKPVTVVITYTDR